MKVHYPLDSKVVLDPEKRELLFTMKKAGVDKIWLHGYFYGHMVSSVEDMVKAKDVLYEMDFEVGVINLPLGHPGNALNPDDPTLELALPPHWRYRIDRQGNKVYFCADIESGMTNDSVAAMTMLRDAGFTEIFMDDDIRQGNWDREIQGCFCDACVERFNRTWERNESRVTLSRRIQARETGDVLKEWMSFQCSKVTDFMKALAVPGVRLGAMLMADGDERHGIDAGALKREIPDCLFRVGEHQFTDKDFGTPVGKALELISVQKQLNRIGRENVYSETTCFPHRALSAANLICKAKMAICAGISNIMLMSGTYVYEEDYWGAWGEHQDELRRMESDFAPWERITPVHFAYGSHGVYQEALYPTTLPTLSGLPVKPVRGCEQDAAGGELLLVFGNYVLDRDWEQVLSGYKKVILDAAAARTNPDKIDHSNDKHVEIWNHEVGTGDPQDEIRGLRALIGQDPWEFPWIASGDNVVLFWLKDRHGVIVFNMEEKSSTCMLSYKGIQRDVSLSPLSCQWVSI